MAATKKPKAPKPAPEDEEPSTEPTAGKPGKGRRVRVRADLGHGGSLHVRHMGDRDIRLDGVELAETAGVADDKPVWIQLAKPGAFRGHPAGPFELNTQVFGDIVRNFKATQNRAIPIDFEHASEADPTEGRIPTEGAPAQGWIRDLRIDGAGLWGLVDWGTKAREYIRSGQYKFFSPAIRFNAKDRVTGERIGARMTSGALTNNPFLDGLKPLVASDRLDRLLDLLDVIEVVEDDEDDTDDGDDAESDNQSAADRGLSTEDTNMADTAEKIALSEAQTKVAELSLKMKDETARADKAEGELATLRDWKEKRESKDIEERVELAFDTYKDARKLTDADKDAMRIVLTAKPETFEKQYPKVKAGEQHLLKNVTEQKREAPPAAVAGETVDERLCTETFGQTTTRLMGEKKISYLAASSLATKLRGR